MNLHAGTAFYKQVLENIEKRDFIDQNRDHWQEYSVVDCDYLCAVYHCYCLLQ